MYRYIQVAAFDHQNQWQRTALIGKELTEKEKYTLWLANEDRPLSVSGDTWIQGTVFLPPAGVRKAYIEGEAFAHDKAVQGSIHDSQPALPPLKAEWLERIHSLLQGDTLTDMAAPIIRLQDSILTDSVAGCTVIYSEKPLTIRQTAQLETVIIAAPAIRVEDGFRGEVQLFARDSISIGRDVFLRYPSAVGLAKKKAVAHGEPEQPYIRIDSGARIDGIVFTAYEAEQLGALIRIAPKATVNGQVYADGLLELQGTVNGTTLCRRFFLKTGSTVYENFILNGRMDFDALSRYYAGSPLLHMGKQYAVIKWLERKWLGR